MAEKAEKSYETTASWTKGRRFLAHYFVDGVRHDKWVPVNVAWEPDHRQLAIIWVDEWVKKGKQTGRIPNNDAVPRPKRTIRNLLQQWYDWKLKEPGIERKALDKERAGITNYVLAHSFGDVDLEKPKGLTTVAVGWIEWLKLQDGVHTKKRLAPFTVRNIVAAVRGFISDVRGKGWAEMAENPFVDSFVQKRTAGAEKVAGADTIIHLSPTQATAFIQCADPRLPPHRRAADVLSITSGLRTEEVQGLGWSHLHLTGDVPYVDVQRQLKLRGQLGIAQFKAPKKRSHRQVPLHPVAVQVLTRWKGLWSAYVGRQPNADDAVFPDRNGGFTYHGSAHMFRRDLTIAGIPQQFEGHNQTYHSLRRTFLTMLSIAGVEEHLIGRLAGHAKRTVTQKHYVSKDLPLLYAAVLKLQLPNEVGWAETGE